jgi:hypothetical protein
MSAVPILNTAEGCRRKREALAMLEAQREVLINRGRRALLAAMLAGDGTATADDVRADVDLPPSISPNLFGAVPGALSRAGIIRLARLRLAHHPDRADPVPPGNGAGLLHTIQLKEEPGAGTPGSEGNL